MPAVALTVNGQRQVVEVDDEAVGSDLNRDGRFVPFGAALAASTLLAVNRSGPDRPRRQGSVEQLTTLTRRRSSSSTAFDGRCGVIGVNRRHSIPPDRTSDSGKWDRASAYPAPAGAVAAGRRAEDQPIGCQRCKRRDAGGSAFLVAMWRSLMVRLVNRAAFVAACVMLCSLDTSPKAAPERSPEALGFSGERLRASTPS